MPFDTFAALDFLYFGEVELRTGYQIKEVGQKG